MPTLYKRATVSQVRVLRILEGAIRNASHVHPEWAVPNHMARSIAKRAAGTLTADWPDVLAAGRQRSERATAQVCEPPSTRRSSEERLGRRAPHPARRSPLQRALALLSHEIGRSKRAGDPGRMAALIHAIRIIAAVEKVDQFTTPVTA